MATPKPNFSSSNFLRAVRSCRPQTYRSIRFPPPIQPSKTHFHSSIRKNQETGFQRYGPAANGPMPPPSKPTEPYLPSTEQNKKDATTEELKRAERHKREGRDQPGISEKQANASEAEKKTEEQHNAEAREEPTETNLSQDAETSKAQQASSAGNVEAPLQDDKPLPNRELDVVLSMPTPTQLKEDPSAHHHPHLEASPYEHHFDTYTLVQDLCSTDPNTQVQAFTEEQSVTVMKAVRLMLAQNLDLAKDGLVSKSDTENETYLFRAACSELKTTILTSRFVEAQKQRTQRAQLQHEFDILNQKVSQDVMSMREELKGMFNDRKLGLEEEKRQIDGKIQSLSYRISVDLNSEAKSEVEGLRWVLTRRAALAIIAAAGMVLGFLQYYSIRSREQAEIEKKRKKAQMAQDEQIRRDQERFESRSSSGATVGQSRGTQTDGIVLGGTAGSNYEESLG